MGSTYIGVAANAPIGGAVSATVPADGDNDNAATFTVGTQKVLDYLAALSQASVLSTRTTVADTPYAALVTDILIAYTSLTASRVVTLPSATGNTQRIVIKDESGNASNLIMISVLAQAGQSVDGTANPTTLIAIDTPYGAAEFYSNGVKWFQLY